MAEFAALAGFSRPTVSRYFRDPQSVLPSTRRRIEQALETYSYRPNLLAANLNRRNTRILGVLVPNINDPFYTELIRNIEIEASGRGYFTIALSSHGEAQGERRAIERLLSMNVFGVVAAPLGFASDLEGFEQLGRRVPLVTVDARVPLDATFIGSDNQMGIRLVVDYLLRTGAQPVYFDMPHVNSNSLERREAYLGAMQREGLAPWVVADGSDDRGWDFERFGVEHGMAFMAAEGRRLRGRAIVCANDRIAFGVLSAAFKSGIRVGRRSESDLRVAGHDNQPLSEFTCPGLTTAAQDIPGIAQAAVAEVMTQAQGGGSTTPVARTLEARLILRDSA